MTVMVAQKEIVLTVLVIAVHVQIAIVKLVLVRIQSFVSELILINLEYDYKRCLGTICRRHKTLYSE